MTPENRFNCVNCFNGLKNRKPRITELSVAGMVQRALAMRPRGSGQIEAVQIHHLVPDCNKVAHEGL